MSQSEYVLEWFTESDWQSKMRAVQNDKPSKFTIYNGSQSETVRKVKFDTFAWSFSVFIQSLKGKFSVNPVKLSLIKTR